MGDLIEIASASVAPTKDERQDHGAFADTVDPADTVDRVEYQCSDDGGKTWRCLAFVTGAVAAPPPNDPKGPINRPGVIRSMERDDRGFWRAGTPQFVRDTLVARGLGYCAIVQQAIDEKGQPIPDTFHAFVDGTTVAEAAPFEKAVAVAEDVVGFRLAWEKSAPICGPDAIFRSLVKHSTGKALSAVAANLL